MASGQTIRIEGLDKILKGIKNFPESTKKRVIQIFYSGLSKEQMIDDIIKELRA